MENFAVPNLSVSFNSGLYMKVCGKAITDRANEKLEKRKAVIYNVEKECLTMKKEKNTEPEMDESKLVPATDEEIAQVLEEVLDEMDDEEYEYTKEEKVHLRAYYRELFGKKTLKEALLVDKKYKEGQFAPDWDGDLWTSIDWVEDDAPSGLYDPRYDPESSEYDPTLDPLADDD